MKRVINGKTYSKIIGVKKGEFPIFGDDGELQSSGKKPSDIPEGLPSGGTQGQVLTKGASAPEWADVPSELPTIGSGDAGKVLKVNAGETGTEWGTAGGGNLYVHNMQLSDNSHNAIVLFTIISDSSTPITTTALLNAYLISKGVTTQNGGINCSGRFNDNGYKFPSKIWSDSDSGVLFSLQEFDGGNSSLRDTTGLVFNDGVIAV